MSKNSVEEISQTNLSRIQVSEHEFQDDFLKNPEEEIIRELQKEDLVVVEESPDKKKYEKIEKKKTEHKISESPSTEPDKDKQSDVNSVIKFNLVSAKSAKADRTLAS